MRIILYREALVPAAVNMPDSDCSMRNVISLRVCQSNPSHEVRQIAIAPRPQEQMPVIAHYAIAADPHLETLDALGENLLKGEKITGLTKNPEPTISPIQGVVNITAQRNPLIAAHVGYYIWRSRDINKKIP